MSKRKPVPEPCAGYVYMGTWIDGVLGWSLSEHMNPVGTSEKEARKCVSLPAGRERSWSMDAPHYLCRIEVSPVLDSLGRPIVRYPRKDWGEGPPDER